MASNQRRNVTREVIIVQCLHIPVGVCIAHRPLGGPDASMHDVIENHRLAVAVSPDIDDRESVFPLVDDLD